MADADGGAQIACPECGVPYPWRDQIARRKIRCPCGCKFRMPAEPAAAPVLLESAAGSDEEPVALDPERDAWAPEAEPDASPPDGEPAPGDDDGEGTAEEDNTIPLDLDAGSIAGAGEAEASSKCPNCGRALSAGAVICVGCGYNLETGESMAPGGPEPESEAGAPAPSRGRPGRRGNGALPEAASGFSGFLRCMEHTLQFPSRPSDLGNWLIAWFMLIAAELSFLACCFGFIAQIVIYGLYWGFQFNIVHGAAGAEEELPPFTPMADFGVSVIQPVLNMLTARGVLFLPVLGWVFLDVYLLSDSPQAVGEALVSAMRVYALGAIDLRMLANPLFYIVMICQALWPVVLLVIAVGGTEALVRIDRIVATIFKSLPAYGIIVATVYLSYFASEKMVAHVLGLSALTASFELTTGAVLLLILIPGVQSYFMIVAMRAIGFYYHCFKNRFTWSWG